MPIADSDQPAHLCSLIRVFDGCSMGKQGINVSSGGKLRLTLYSVDGQTDLSLQGTHMPTSTLCWIPAQMIDNISLCHFHAEIQSGDRRVWTPPPPLENHKTIGFLSKTGPEPQENHIASKPAFNVGPLSACQQNAI